MARNGFATIFIGIIVVAVLAIGVSSYVVVSLFDESGSVEEIVPLEVEPETVIIEEERVTEPVVAVEEPQQMPSPLPVFEPAPQSPTNQLPPPASSRSEHEDQKVDYDIYAEVWTKNGYDGASYEFKVNCGPNYARLETCFLWDLSAVVVTGPDGKRYELTKDFNVQGYSGEVTRRWVLYGPAGASFPVPGVYRFLYYRGDKIAYAHDIHYQPTTISYPTEIVWQRDGNDFVVSWRPPQGMETGMWYKVLLFRKNGEVISAVVEWNASNARLKNLPLGEGEQADMNVTSYFHGGYAYPKNIPIVWSASPSTSPSPSGGISQQNCSSNISPVFTHHITDISKVQYVAPPPTMGAGPNLKTHGYIGTEHALVPVYGPVTMTVKDGSHYVGGPYMFDFAVSCEVTVRFGHMTNPVDALKQLLPVELASDSRTQSLSPVSFAAGELVGYTTGTDQAGNWDFGVYNSATQNRYASDPDWNWSTVLTTAVCPFGYFTPDLKAAYISKFNPQIMAGNPPHGESFCGT